MPERKRTVLVVDDDVINRHILCGILNDDYDTLQAENGREALELLRAHADDISAVLLDIVMPVMDGYEFLNIQQATPAICAIPVLVTSNIEKEEAELKALRSGAADFLSKPYRPNVIRHRLKSVIDMRETIALVRTIERDSLTGLYNKDSFYEMAAKELNANPAVPYDLVAVDVDFFRFFSDTFGAGEADNLLIFIAQALSELCSSEAGLCARMDGDHFMLLIKRSVRTSVNFPEQLNEKLYSSQIKARITVRFGVYVIDDRSVSIRSMCDRAQLAAESIKGKYGVLSAEYDDSIRQRMLDETEITNGMAAALKNKEFVVYIQPKYELNTEKIAGAEALVRWQHPTRGFLPPDMFIPLFERNGFIMELDYYVWEQTCLIIRSWLDRGEKYVPVSVNVSRADIQNPELPEKLIELINRHGLEPKHLHLEITETAYTQNPRQLIAVVSRLKALGFVIEMDDFGSGYSSLNMLSELPIDVLKLDMKFIQNEGKVGKRNILSFVISLAKWLNLIVVAEGVETEQQVMMLRNMDCTMVQGYYYSRPLPAEQFTRLLMNSDAVLLEPSIRPVEIGSDKVTLFPKSGAGICLIVDDLELNRAVLVEIFSPYYSIATADNGAAAYNFLVENKDKIAFVMLDLVMPIMDGFQVLQKIKENSELRGIPVIITSQASDESETRVLEMGASDYITKPYNPDVVLRRVQNAIAGNAFRMGESI